MSWKGTAFVRDLHEGITSTEKFVLMMLGEYHRTDGKNEWRSVETLTHDCMMTVRAMKRILARLEKKDFVRRYGGGGRGHIASYQIVGLDVQKGGRKTVVSETTVSQTVAETVATEVRNSGSARQPNKVLPVLESNRLGNICSKHPNSGLTQRGGCWDCYANKYSAGASA